jgi:ABC-type multidrug transport system fused ATPase/permease subunit
VLVDRAVKKLLENRTSIIIAHKLATLNQVDSIAIIDKGIIIEKGERRELTKDETSKFSQLLKTGLTEVLE